MWEPQKSGEENDGLSKKSVLCGDLFHQLRSKTVEEPPFRLLSGLRLAALHHEREPNCFYGIVYLRALQSFVRGHSFSTIVLPLMGPHLGKIKSTSS